MTEFKKSTLEELPLSIKKTKTGDVVSSSERKINYNDATQQAKIVTKKKRKTVLDSMSSLQRKLNDWTPEEDALLIEKQGMYPDNWGRIASFFSFKTSTAVKNRWNTKFKHQDNEKIQTIQINQQLKAENDNLTKANSSITEANNSVTKVNGSDDTNFFNSESSDYDPFASPFYF